MNRNYQIANCYLFPIHTFLNYKMRLLSQYRVFVVLMIASIVLCDISQGKQERIQTNQPYVGLGTEKHLRSSSLTKNRQIQQNYIFLDQNISSNVLTTTSYALFSQNNNRSEPTLKKLNFKTMELQSLVYPVGSSYLLNTPAVLADLKNGDIAFGIGANLLILNNQTLQLKQRVPITFTFIGEVLSVDVWLNPSNNESKIIVGTGHGGISYSQIKKDSRGVYQSGVLFSTGRTYRDYYNIFLTGSNSAVSIRQCNVWNYTNLKSIIHRSYDQKYYLLSRQKVAISFDQTFFVIRNDEGFYEFYSFDNQFDVTLKKTIFISYNDHVKGMMTNDDKNLFVSMSNPREKHNIAKINIENGEFTLITDSDGSSDNQLDFCLLSASYNRFVTVSVRNIKGNKAYYLALKAIDTLQQIDEFLINLDFPVLEYKLIGNTQWNQTFGLVVRTSQYAWNIENDSNILMFTMKGDKLQNLGLKENVSYNNLGACFTYIVSRKPGFQLKLFHFSNLSLALKADYGSIVNIIFEKDTFVLTFNYQQFTLHFFNLRESLKPKGFFSRDLESDGEYESFIFAKRGVLCDILVDDKGYSFIVKKAVYNISSLVSTSRYRIDQPYCKNELYYASPQTVQPQCNFVFFLQFSGQNNLNIAKYSECSKEIERYFVNKYSDKGLRYSSLSYSSDKKYMIILYLQRESEYLWVDIRPISSLEIIAHKQTLKIAAVYEFSADFANGELLVVRDQINIYTVLLGNEQKKGEKQIQNIRSEKLARK